MRSAEARLPAAVQARQAGRLYAHAKQIAGKPSLEEVFAWPLARASQIRSQRQRQRQRGWKLYSFHALEVERICAGKARAPYELGTEVSVVTSNGRAPGAQFVLGARTLPGTPYTGEPCA